MNVLPGSMRPTRDEKMLLSRTGVMTLWTDIFTLRPELNSGPTTQRTYGSRPRHDVGQEGPVSWLRDSHAQSDVTCSVISDLRGWDSPEQLGSYSGTDWQGWDEWQTRGLDGWELSVIERGKTRCERVT